MRHFYFLISITLYTACIPIKVAPKFKAKDYKIMLAKKFKRKLPKAMTFIFKAPKDEGEIYDYFNKKYQLNDRDVGINTPFKIDDKLFYLSYTEVSKDDENFNFGLVIADAVLEEKTGLKGFENYYSSRKGHWYIILTVYDNAMKNALKDNHPMKASVVDYLNNLRIEYMTTTNYEELLFKKKS